MIFLHLVLKSYNRARMQFSQFYMLILPIRPWCPTVQSLTLELDHSIFGLGTQPFGHGAQLFVPRSPSLSLALTLDYLTMPHNMSFTIPLATYPLRAPFSLAKHLIFPSRLNDLLKPSLSHTNKRTHTREHTHNKHNYRQANRLTSH